jgi:hypothetical protein
MLGRSVPLLLCASLLCSMSHAEEAKVTIQMKGIGSLTCSHWRSTRATRTEGVIWILGFWTGLNYVAAASEQAQPNSSEAAVIAQVEKVCAENPNQVLASAAWTAYLDMSKK